MTGGKREGPTWGNTHRPAVSHHVTTRRRTVVGAVEPFTPCNCATTYCQIVICLNPILSFLSRYFGGNAWSGVPVLATLGPDGAGPDRAALRYTAVTPITALPSCDSLPCTAAVRALGDRVQGAWPTEGPHCHNTGDAPRLGALGAVEWGRSWLSHVSQQLR